MPTIRTTTPDIHIGTTVPRPTAEPASIQFRDALGAGAMTVLSGIEQAAGLVPGGGVVAAAVRAGASTIGGSAGGGSPSTTGAPATSGAIGGSQDGPQALLNSQTNQAMELLEMQQQISMEQRQFQTVSNVMKARHDTAKSVIQNVR